MIPKFAVFARRRISGVTASGGGLAGRHKKHALAVLNDLPSGALGRAMWRLTHVLTTCSYPHPAQQAFVAELIELMLTDPDFAATIRRSAGEEPVL